MSDHEWKYVGDRPEESPRRLCGACGMTQWTVEPGEWDSPELVLWRLGDDEPWGEMTAPECPGPPEPESEWRRVEDDHPRWEISNPKGDGKNYLCTDMVIRTFGRQHVERLLRDLPPLPDKAWEAAS